MEDFYYSECKLIEFIRSNDTLSRMFKDQDIIVSDKTKKIQYTQPALCTLNLIHQKYTIPFAVYERILRNLLSMYDQGLEFFDFPKDNIIIDLSDSFTHHFSYTNIGKVSVRKTKNERHVYEDFLQERCCVFLADIITAQHEGLSNSDSIAIEYFRDKYITDEDHKIQQTEEAELYSNRLCGEDVVIKVYKQLDEVIFPIQLITEEFTILSNLSHKNIPRCLGLVDMPESLGIVFGLASMKPLSAYKDSDVSYKVKLLLNSINGLLYLHSKSIVHLNITPDTIQISNGEDVNLFYFQYSKRVNTFDFSKRTQIAYSSPELIGKGTASPSSDVWSFGMTMYSLFVKEPFEVESSSIDASSSRKTLYEPIERIQKFMVLLRDGRKPYIPNEFSLKHQVIASLMKDLWNLKPKDRMTLQELKDRLPG